MQHQIVKFLTATKKLKKIEPDVHRNSSSKFIYIDTQEQGVVAMLIW